MVARKSKSAQFDALLPPPTQPPEPPPPPTAPQRTSRVRPKPYDRFAALCARFLANGGKVPNTVRLHPKHLADFLNAESDEQHYVETVHVLHVARPELGNLALRVVPDETVGRDEPHLTQE